MKSARLEQPVQAENTKHILEKFREDNPFTLSASPLPWKNHNPDVSSINRNAEEEIAHLIRQKRYAPWGPLAGLVIGEAGVGKTHMLMRILNRMKDYGQIALFVAVRAFTDSKTVLWDLLQEIGVSLESRRQSEILIAELKRAYKDCCEEDGFVAQDTIDLRILQRQIRQRQMHRIDDNNVLRFVLAYDKAINENNDNVRSDLIMWLTGVADEDIANEYDLPKRNFDAMENPEREEAARKTILSFSGLLEYARIPMVVCLDQLDMMEDETLINAWGACVNLLVNDMPSVLPLAFLRMDTWVDTFEKVLDRAVRERLQNNKILMGNCDFDQARELIRQRIENSPAFKSTPSLAENAFQWLFGILEEKLANKSYPPRIVIDLANRAIYDASESPIPPESGVTQDWQNTCKIFDDELSKEIQKVADSLQDWPPSERWLFDALNTWWRSRPELNLKPVDESANKYIRLTGKLTTTTDESGQKLVDCAFIIVASKAHSRAFAALNRGTKFLRDHPDARCWYITDGRTHKGPDRWKKVAQSMAEFEKLGGTVLILNKNACADWYGFLAFVNKIRNGDVTLYPINREPRPAKEQDLQDWLKENFELDLLRNTLSISKCVKSVSSEHRQLVNRRSYDFISDCTCADSSKSNDDQFLLETLSSFFSSSGIQILDAKDAIERYRKNNIEISLDELQIFVARHHDCFELIGTKTAPIILKVQGAAK